MNSKSNTRRRNLKNGRKRPKTSISDEILTKDWLMPSMCDNCPFQSKGPGWFLRRSLRPGRWRAILRGLRQEQYFECHKTVTYDEEGEGGNWTPKSRICAGALAWQNRHGIIPQFQQVLTRLTARRRGTTNP